MTSLAPLLPLLLVLLHSLRWMYPDFVDFDKDDDEDSDSSEDPDSDPCAFLVPAFELEDFFLSVFGFLSTPLFTLLSTALLLFLKNNNNLLLLLLLLPLPKASAIQPSKFHHLKPKS